MARILFVSKDMGGANVTVPLALQALRRGDDVVAVVEGLAAARYEKWGLIPYFKGTVNFKEEPFTLDSQAMLKRINPDLVVVSAGFPINLEHQFASAANAYGIPFVAAEDFWGGSSRLQETRPSLILTPDEYGVALAHKRFGNVPACAVGNSGISDAEPRVEAFHFFSELRKRYSAVFAFVGGEGYTTADIMLLSSCLERTHANWCLIPRLHPKCEKNLIPGTQEMYGEMWRGMFNTLGERVIYAPNLASDDVVLCADMTLAAFSTLLTTAAYAGKTAVSIQTRESMASLERQAGLDEVPVVALGCAHAVRAPVDLSTFRPLTDAVREKLKPYDSKAAYEAINQLL